jgi:hypothetical protein
LAGVVPGGGSAVAPAEAATRCGGPVAEGQIRVAIVVDPGPGAGGPSATCLVVARGTTGSQLLAERAAALGVARPRYADSGLLCAFDGYPATGCGERTADGYRYWAYFSGTSGSWVYGSGNPFLRRLADGDVEGWRFVDGTGTGQDPPPRLSPSGLFPPLVAPAPPPAPAPAPAPVPGGGVPTAPAAGSPGPTPPAGGSGADPTGSAPAAAGTGPSDAVPSTASAASAGIADGAGEGRDGSSASAGTDDGEGSDPASSELAADVAVSSSSPAGPIGAVVAGVVIVVLVVAAVRRARAGA